MLATPLRFHHHAPPLHASAPSEAGGHLFIAVRRNDHRTPPLQQHAQRRLYRPAVRTIEAIEGLVQQQQRRLCHPRPRQQHAAALAIGKLQKPASLQLLQAKQAHRTRHFCRLSTTQLPQRNIRTVETRTDDLAQPEVPVTPRITVLVLAGHMQHTGQHIDRIHFSSGSINPTKTTASATTLAYRRRPSLTGHEFAELGLASAIAACQHPAFAGTDLPAHPAQNVAVAQCQVNAIKANTQRAVGGSLLPTVASKLAPTSIDFPVGGSLLPTAWINHGAGAPKRRWSGWLPTGAVPTHSARSSFTSFSKCANSE